MDETACFIDDQAKFVTVWMRTFHSSVVVTKYGTFSSGFYRILWMKNKMSSFLANWKSHQKQLFAEKN